MPHSMGEAQAFVDECRYALEHLFQALVHHQKAARILASMAEQLNAATRASFNRFMSFEFSPRANFEYVQHMQRLEALGATRTALASKEGRDRLRVEMLARV